MKAHSIILTIVAITLALSLQAQNAPKIEFDNTTHEFGTLQKGDPAEHTFTFTNTSDAAITLQRVKASCGCTTPSWTRESIEPGGSGTIDVKYNSNRVGAFTKTVTVTYEEGARPVVLYIKGKVDAPAAQVVDIYKEKQGNLAFDLVGVNVGQLNSDQEKTLTFQVKNIGPKPIKFTGENSKEMMYEVATDRNELIPGENTRIQVRVIGERYLSEGSFSHSISLGTTDEINPSKTLSVSGFLKRVFSEEELAAMPNLVFETLEYDAGKVIEGEKVTYAFQFSNTGQNDLVLESVKASCGCTATAPKDKLIRGGANSEIVATFDSRNRKGPQTKTITVRSNDPDQATIVLKLKVEVEKDPFHMDSFGPASGGLR
ncbi:MAG: DUF1573 domain-containing protein [Bacteroidota bacterium]